MKIFKIKIILKIFLIFLPTFIYLIILLLLVIFLSREKKINENQTILIEKKLSPWNKTQIKITEDQYISQLKWIPQTQSQGKISFFIDKKWCLLTDNVKWLHWQNWLKKIDLGKKMIEKKWKQELLQIWLKKPNCQNKK